MGRLELGEDGTQVEPLLSGYMKDVDDVSLSPPKDGRKMKKKGKRSFLNKHYRLLKRILKVREERERERDNNVDEKNANLSVIPCMSPLLTPVVQ